MSLRSAHCEIRALTARRASHQLWSYAGLIVERYSSLSASVAGSTASLVGAILNALHYSANAAKQFRSLVKTDGVMASLSRHDPASNKREHLSFSMPILFLRAAFPFRPIRGLDSSQREAAAFAPP
jgi:hypothetical protein